MARQEARREAERDRHGGELAEAEQAADIFFHRDGIWLTKRFLNHVVELAEPFIDPDVDLDLNPK